MWISKNGIQVFEGVFVEPPDAELIKLGWRRSSRALCGTRAAYEQHLELDEPTCLKCRRSNAKRRRRYEAKRAATS